MTAGEARPGILVLGAGIMQIPSLEAARENGWFLLVADGNPEALGRGLADEFHVVDLKDEEGLLELARGYFEDGLLHGVFTAGTDFSTSVAYVADGLGLPGISYETALNATDKARMRHVLSEAGVRCPCFAMLGGVAELEKAALPEFPLVVKPVDNMGARGVRRVETETELSTAVADAAAYSRSGRVIVEEFLDGPEFSVDALVVEGRVHLCGIADRHIRFPPYFIEVGHTMPTEYGREAREEIARALGEAARALGIRNGAAKGDIFLTSEGGVVGEVAARLSGGYMSGWTYPYASGVPVTEAAMRLALGLPPGDLSPRFHWTSVERAAVSIPGTVVEVRGVETARRHDRVRDLFERAQPGDRVVFPRNNTEKCANVITAAPDRGEAVEACEQAVADLVFRLEAGTPETAAFLADDEGPWAFRPELARIPPQQARRRAGTEGDWNYRSLARTLEMIGGLTEAHPPEENPGFMRAVLKGGLQGGLFYLDTIRRDPGMLGALRST